MQSTITEGYFLVNHLKNAGTPILKIKYCQKMAVTSIKIHIHLSKQITKQFTQNTSLSLSEEFTKYLSVKGSIYTKIH